MMKQKKNFGLSAILFLSAVIFFIGCGNPNKSPEDVGKQIVNALKKNDKEMLKVLIPDVEEALEASLAIFDDIEAIDKIFNEMPYEISREDFDNIIAQQVEELKRMKEDKEQIAEQQLELLTELENDFDQCVTSGQEDFGIEWKNIAFGDVEFQMEDETPGVVSSGYEMNINIDSNDKSLIIPLSGIMLNGQYYVLSIGEIREK
ncbi:MAG: hypothetical protein RQ866_04945 [Bacteroidales bacterium]|nr:hypothetical protein [Bacteroidales bacterium]